MHNQKEVEIFGGTHRYLGMLTSMKPALNQYRIKPEKHSSLILGVLVSLVHHFDTEMKKAKRQTLLNLLISNFFQLLIMLFEVE